METEEFEKFVADEQVTDPDIQTRDQWLKDLDSLYRNVDGFLAKYIKDGSISRDFTEIKLTEPGIGTYLARRMDIRIGRRHVALVPVGTLLVGCKGRVDAEGSGGRVQIWLVQEHNDRSGSRHGCGARSPSSACNEAKLLGLEDPQSLRSQEVCGSRQEDVFRSSCRSRKCLSGSR